MNITTEKHTDTEIINTTSFYSTIKKRPVIAFDLRKYSTTYPVEVFLTFNDTDDIDSFISELHNLKLAHKEAEKEGLLK